MVKRSGSSVKSLRGCDDGEWKLGVDSREYVRLVYMALLSLGRREYKCVGVDRGVCGGYSCVQPGEMDITGVDWGVAGRSSWHARSDELADMMCEMVEKGVERPVSSLSQHQLVRS